jgi:hypothetical protein
MNEQFDIKEIEEAAKKLGLSIRVVSEDGVDKVVSSDYDSKRANLTIINRKVVNIEIG